MDYVSSTPTQLVNRDKTISPLRPEMTYQDWIDAYESSDGLESLLRRRTRSLRRHPLISILLPVYNPELEYLRAAIGSVQAQIYPNWQLCIADDASTDKSVRPFLEQIARDDSRIALTFCEENGHIAAASNSALTLATGEWCAFLDQDDLLTPTALAFVASEANDYPEARLIYSDEDKINGERLRSDPYFKPDWNPELFLAQNYINHLGVYHTGMLRDLGGFREGFDGSQDYDLALRFVEKLRPEQVRHIPRILYHWRAIPGSLAGAIEAKPEATNGARRALTEHLERCKIAARVTACRENPARHRIIYELPDNPPLVSIIIPTRDHVNLLRRCVEGIREQTDYERIELVVVDNDSAIESTRDYLAELSKEKDTQVLHESGAFNYSRLNNLGAQAARGDILAFLNNDIEVDEPGWLREMVSHVLQPQVGAVGARLWYPNQTLQHGGVVLGLGGMAAHVFGDVRRGFRGYFDRLSLQQDCSAVTGACMLVRKEVFQKMGGFDEEHFAVSYNDIDFCLRLREHGLRVVLTPYANLIHHESVSRGRVRTPEADEQFFREAATFRDKWGAQLLSDPFYNPNLSLKAPGFALAFPPRVTPMTLPSAGNGHIRAAELEPV